MFQTDLPEEDRLAEEKHLAKIVSSFVSYEKHCLSLVAKKKKDFEALPQRLSVFIAEPFSARQEAVEDRIKANYLFIKEMIQDHMHMDHEKPSESDMDKVLSTLRQFVRDWSEYGSKERDAVYNPILETLEKLFPGTEERDKVNVLVPGAGLGRLTLEIVKRGFSCQGNEFSFHMLLGSNFVLNCIDRPLQYTIYPWIHSSSNLLTTDDQLQGIQIPDTIPQGIPPGADFSMIAGEFVEVYGATEQHAKWDCIVTCFFIDTAKNVIQYLETIYRALKPGGYWINMGPLLYHFEGMKRETSVELTFDEIKLVSERMGFSFESEPILVPCTYTCHHESLLHYSYKAIWSVARK